MDNRWLDELAGIDRSAGLWLRAFVGNHDAHPLADPLLRADCDTSTRQVARALRATSPRLRLHGHYHRRYRASCLETGIEGIASDIEAPNGSFVVLDLASLSVS